MTTLDSPRRLSVLAPHQPGVRPEIQALRAIAVLSVVGYHIWPTRLTGGYAGVDVFFVISGFLITAHLFRELERTGRISLPQFWARRARRLLPASFVVIAASAIATVLLAPQSLWQQFFREFGASALYVINWVLAGDAVDYLAADNLPSPVQHYWSLAAEEQFYLVWPLLMLVGVFVASRRRNPHLRITLIVVLGIVTVSSFAYSVVLTVTDPASAYFVTPVRAWEFGAGAILALASTHGRSDSPRPFLAIRSVTSWIGLGLIAATMLVYTPATPFPGWEALLPVLGTLAVIWAGSPTLAWAPTTLMRLRPVQWTGDVSYSLYLWHWPIIVLLPFVTSAKSALISATVLIAAFVLAALSKRFIEDPVRSSRVLTSRKPRLTLGLTAAAMVIVVAVSAGTWMSLQAKYDASEAQAQIIAETHGECFGAAARAPENQPCFDPSLVGVLVPDPGGDQHDRVIKEGCRASSASTQIITCTIVKAGKGRPHVVLVGDSHAEHWTPAIAEIAKQNGWGLDTYLKGGCGYGLGVRTDIGPAATKTCATWVSAVHEKISTGSYDLIIMSSSSKKDWQGGFEAGVAGFSDEWTSTRDDAGVPIVVIRDTPRMPFNVPDCLTALGSNMAEQAEAQCSAPRSTALGKDPLVDAAKASGTPLIDVTDYFCDADRCYSTIGSVVVYRDDSHLGGTFSKTLAPYIERDLFALIGSLD